MKAGDGLPSEAALQRMAERRAVPPRVAVSVYWSMMWRTMVVILPVGIMVGGAAGLAAGMSGYSPESFVPLEPGRPSVWFSAIAIMAACNLVIGIPVTMSAMRRALLRLHHGHAVVLVSIPGTTRRDRRERIRAWRRMRRSERKSDRAERRRDADGWANEQRLREN